MTKNRRTHERCVCAFIPVQSACKIMSSYSLQMTRSSVCQAAVKLVVRVMSLPKTKAKCSTAVPLSDGKVMSLNYKVFFVSQAQLVPANLYAVWFKSQNKY